jgi:hypothetical protein
VSGRWIQLEQLLDRVDYIDSLTAAAHPNRQADPAEFVDHVPPLSGKLSPLDLKTRGLEDMTNASLQRSRQS